MAKKLEVKKEIWDKEFLSGRWNCLDENPAERARHAIIGMYCQKYFLNGKILDIGCGEGTLTDFLNGQQKKNYLGIDISSAAVEIGKSRRPFINFQCISAESFQTDNKFDVVIFNEILYYTNYKEIIKKYIEILNDDGLIIISLYRIKNDFPNIKDLINNLNVGSRKIEKEVNKILDIQNTTEIIGKIENNKYIWKIMVLKNNQMF